MNRQRVLERAGWTSVRPDSVDRDNLASVLEAIARTLQLDAAARAQRPARVLLLRRHAPVDKRNARGREAGEGAGGHRLGDLGLGLLLGGLFLIGKSTFEIHDKLEGEEGEVSVKVKPSFKSVIFQIIILDLVFSLDSVITAIGMADEIAIMIIAVVIAVGFMMIFAKPIGEFVEKHPTVKMLALSFLILIGVSLVAEGLEQHIPKGYIYFAMAFSVLVEMLNLKLKSKKQPPVHLRKPYSENEPVQETAQ